MFKTFQSFLESKNPEQETTEQNPEQDTAEKKVDEEENKTLQYGGRKRGKKSKKNRKKKKKSKSKKRGGFGACPAEKCPCPRWGGKDRGMCVRERANGRGRWFNYKYGEGKTYIERQRHVNGSDDLRAKRADFVAEGKAIAKRQKTERDLNEAGLNKLAKQDNLAGNTARFAQGLGVKSIFGGRRRKKSKKNRKKSKKNRKKSKKNRKKSKKNRKKSKRRR